MGLARPESCAEAAGVALASLACCAEAAGSGLARLACCAEAPRDEKKNTSAPEHRSLAHLCLVNHPKENPAVPSCVVLFRRRPFERIRSRCIIRNAAASRVAKLDYN